MPTIRFDVKGSEQLKRNLGRLSGRERKKAQQDGLEAGARIVETHIKLLLSKPGSGRLYIRGNVAHRASQPGEPPAVDTGFLRNSIVVDEPVTPELATISAGAEYAEYLEFGTTKMAARPYMRPAIDQNEGEILNAVEKTVAAFVNSVKA